MIRRIPTSVRKSSTWAKSASSVHAPALLQSPCGQHSSCCRSSKPANLRMDCVSSRDAAMLMHQKISADQRWASPSRLNSTSWSGRCAPIPSLRRQSSRSKFLLPQPATTSSRVGAVTEQILSSRLVERPARARKRYLPPFRAHEARAPGLVADDLEQTESRPMRCCLNLRRRIAPPIPLTPMLTR